MKTKRSNKRSDAAQYYRQIEVWIPQYVSVTGDADWTCRKVAAWVIKKRLWQQQQGNAVKELARTISRVARQATFTDNNGNKVRKYHAWRLGHDQPTLWSSIDTITPENMRYSVNARRDKGVDMLVKAQIDAEHYNEHYNSGDPITVETDLTQDVIEKRQPTLYDDSPPSE